MHTVFRAALYRLLERTGGAMAPYLNNIVHPGMDAD